MRTRHLGYRYTMVVASGPLAPFSQAWRIERLAVTLAEPRWRPETDVYETATAVTVTVALAGVDADEVEVLVFDDAVVIEGRRWLACEETGVYRAAQIPQGPFRVEVPLPAPADPEGFEARLEDGLLRIRLPKAGAR